jgi:hypothetical protein
MTEISEASDAWQPIETAPRDGTRILTNSGVGIRIVRWLDERGEWGAGWCLANGATHPVLNAIVNASTMTHWHPLPLPPQGAER